VKNNSLLEVPNINSKDAKLKKLIYDVEDSLFNEENYSKVKFEHLCVCSGGTTSSCAKSGFTTLDLRKNHSKIHIDSETKIVTIGGGVIMGDLVNHLQKHNRSFPIGLSKLPGAGYILTGGVSPLSRAYGLAIDNIESIKGFLGNGTFISLKKNQINPEEQLIWEAIKGAAPFFSIITETVFQWPGMGFLFIQAVQFVDIPIMSAYLVFIAFVFVMINFIVDILYYLIDPRIRVKGDTASG